MEAQGVTEAPHVVWRTARGKRVALLGLFYSSPEVCEGSYGIPRHGLQEGLTSARDGRTIVR